MPKHLITLAVTAALVAGVSGAFVHRSATARWTAMTAWATQAEQAWLDADCTREPLYGKGKPGVAFVHYGAATEQARGLLTQDEKRLVELLQDTEPDAAEAAAFATRWAPVLRSLQTGAHSRDARSPILWDKGCEQAVQNLCTSRAVATAAVVQARALLAAGRGQQAVELLLDAAQFGADLMRSPVQTDQMVGTAVTMLATAEALDDAALRSLDQPALRLLASGLQRLDELCPKSLDFTGEALLLANSLRHGDGWESTREQGDLALTSWRYGFSVAWAAADAVLLEAQAAADLQASAELRWPQREQRLRTVLASPAMWQNPLLDVVVPNLWSGERCLRETLTQVRLLRLAVAWRLGDEVPKLVDPLGDGVLKVTVQSGSAVFTSAGVRRDKPIARTAGPR